MVETKASGILYSHTGLTWPISQEGNASALTNKPDEKGIENNDLRVAVPEPVASEEEIKSIQ